MHRRLFILGLVVAALGELGWSPAATGAEVTTTVYVGRYFEVRDHDQPVKYVFDQEKRVARVTGSVSSRTRLQRLRIRTGWNLVSLAVTAENFLGQVQDFNAGAAEPLLGRVYRWLAAPGEYRIVQNGETVPAGTVLWLRARTNQIIAVQGDYTEPTAPTIAAGGALVPSLGLEVWPVSFPPGVTVWKFNAAENAWQAGLPGDLATLGQGPREIAPGDAIYVHSPDSVEIPIPRPGSRVAYYHADHLDSASVVTDAAGQGLEETAYHPFGAVREQGRSGDVDPAYGFTQKERDQESKLHYFEARYVAGSLARFLTVDPYVQRLEILEKDALRNLLLQPGKLNPFAYALNNPVRYNDPDGRDPRPKSTPPRREPPKPEKPRPDLVFRVNGSPEFPLDVAIDSYSIPTRSTPSGNTSAGAGKPSSFVSEMNITRTVDDVSTSLFQTGNAKSMIKSVDVVLPYKDNRTGQMREYRIHLHDVVIDFNSTHLDPSRGGQVENFTLNAGSIRFGDPEPSESTREATRGWTMEPRLGQ